MSEENASADAGNAADTTETTSAATAQADTAQASEATWRDTLPEDIRASTTLGKFETIEGLAKSYINLEKTLGTDKVAIPKEGDTEGWNKVYKALGHPDTAEAYDFKPPEQIPEGLSYNADMDKNLAGIFHKANLTKAQALAAREGLLEMVGQGALDSIETGKQAEAQRQADQQKGEQALKAEWGQAYEQRGKVAGAAINKFLSPETVAALDAANLANNPAIVRDMYKLGVSLAGEKELIGESMIEASPGDIDAAIADHASRHSAALFDKSHPEHAIRLKEREGLFAKRYPEQAA